MNDRQVVDWVSTQGGGRGGGGLVIKQLIITQLILTEVREQGVGWGRDGAGRGSEKS